MKLRRRILVETHLRFTMKMNEWKTTFRVLLFFFSNSIFFQTFGLNKLNLICWLKMEVCKSNFLATFLIKFRVCSNDCFCDFFWIFWEKSCFCPGSTCTLWAENLLFPYIFHAKNLWSGIYEIFTYLSVQNNYGTEYGWIWINSLPTASKALVAEILQSEKSEAFPFLKCFSTEDWNFFVLSAMIIQSFSKSFAIQEF